MVMYLSRLDPIGYWRADASMSRVQSNFIVCPQVVGTTKPVGPLYSMAIGAVHCVEI